LAFLGCGQTYPEAAPVGDAWGDDEIEKSLSPDAGGKDHGAMDIDLDRGPRPDAPYLEQQASTAIYTGAFEEKKSKLNIIIKYLCWQARHKISDIAMDELFKSLHEDIVPKGKDSKGVNIENNMPKSRAEARRVIGEVGFDYVTIDACPCDKTLYYGPQNEHLQSCPNIECGLSRYRSDLKSSKVPRKKMHYFPLAPRLQAIFKSPRYARLMQWAGNHRSSDGWLRYPQDGTAWKRLEYLCPFLKEDFRNVVFGLATDGFNPFGSNSASHSTWPVILVLYNLPPEVAIKSQHLLLSMIVPGEFQNSESKILHIGYGDGEIFVHLRCHKASTWNLRYGIPYITRSA
jgi:hypothetical protein